MTAKNTATSTFSALKVALIIWGPIIISALLYGAIYLTRYEIAKSHAHKDALAYSTCMNNINQQEASAMQHATYVKSTLGDILGSPNDTHPVFNPKFPYPTGACLQPRSIGHGFLGFPVY